MRAASRIQRLEKRIPDVPEGAACFMVQKAGQETVIAAGRSFPTVDAAVAAIEAERGTRIQPIVWEVRTVPRPRTSWALRQGESTSVPRAPFVRME